MIHRSTPQATPKPSHPPEPVRRLLATARARGIDLTTAAEMAQQATPPAPLTPIYLPGLPQDPDAAAAMLDAYLGHRRAQPHADRLAVWDAVRTTQEPE